MSRKPNRHYSKADLKSAHEFIRSASAGDRPALAAEEILWLIQLRKKLRMSPGEFDRLMDIFICYAQREIKREKREAKRLAAENLKLAFKEVKVNELTRDIDFSLVFDGVFSI